GGGGPRAHNPPLVLCTAHRRSKPGQQFPHNSCNTRESITDTALWSGWMSVAEGMKRWVDGLITSVRRVSLKSGRPAPFTRSREKSRECGLATRGLRLKG